MLKRKYTKLFYFFALFGFVFPFALFSAPAANAATLYFSPSSGSYHQGENFTVSASLSTDQSVNAVRGVALFPLKYISVISVDYEDTIVDLWVRKPSFSNFGATGNVTFEGVILNPGFTGSSGKIVDIVFRVKEQGSASVQITDFAILANDGLGTNIASAGGKASFVFTSPLPPGQGNSTTEEKINIIKEKVQKIEEQTKSLSFAQEGNFYLKVNNLWETLPIWIKFITIIFIGVVAISLLLMLGLAAIVIIWIWSHVRYRRPYIKFQLKRFINAIKFFSRKLWSFIGMAGKELENDITYGRLKFEESYREATQQVPMKVMLRDYFSRIGSIVKRFFEINGPREDKISENQTNDEISENKESAPPKDEDKDNF